jgi:hypothetical protein
MPNYSRRNDQEFDDRTQDAPVGTGLKPMTGTRAKSAPHIQGDPMSRDKTRVRPHLPDGVDWNEEESLRRERYRYYHPRKQQYFEEEDPEWRRLRELLGKAFDTVQDMWDALYDLLEARSPKAEPKIWRALEEYLVGLGIDWRDMLDQDFESKGDMLAWIRDHSRGSKSDLDILDEITGWGRSFFGWNLRDRFMNDDLTGGYFGGFFGDPSGGWRRSRPKRFV